MAFWYPPQQNPGIRPQLGPPTMAGAPGGNMQFQPGGPQLGGMPPQLLAFMQAIGKGGGGGVSNVRPTPLGAEQMYQSRMGLGPWAQWGPESQAEVGSGMPPFLSAPTGPGGDPLANSPTGDMTVSGMPGVSVQPRMPTLGGPPPGIGPGQGPWQAPIGIAPPQATPYGNDMVSRFVPPPGGGPSGGGMRAFPFPEPKQGGGGMAPPMQPQGMWRGPNRQRPPMGGMPGPGSPGTGGTAGPAPTPSPFNPFGRGRRRGMGG